LYIGWAVTILQDVERVCLRPDSRRRKQSREIGKRKANPEILKSAMSWCAKTFHSPLHIQRFPSCLVHGCGTVLIRAFQPGLQLQQFQQLLTGAGDGKKKENKVGLFIYPEVLQQVCWVTSLKSQLLSDDPLHRDLCSGPYIYPVPGFRLTNSSVCNLWATALSLVVSFYPAHNFLHIPFNTYFSNYPT